MLAAPESKLQFVIVREISADVDRVFEIIASEAGMKSWIPQCRIAQWRHAGGAGTPGLDSVRYIQLAGGIVAAERILAWEPGRELHYGFDESSLPLGKLTRNYVGVTRIEPIAAGRTRLTWAIHFDAPGWLALCAPLMRASLRPLIGTMAGRIVRLAQA